MKSLMAEIDEIVEALPLPRQTFERNRSRAG
jgi:hypothetical protein